MKRKWRMPRLAQLPPPAMLAILYGTLILIGTVLLVLPVSTTRSIGWMSAFFTSTSAVTVTGLAVVDTGTTFTYFGQAVIALLIQLGGLGLMTFAMLLLSLLNIPIGMPSRLMAREDLNQRSLSNLTYLTALILKIALLSEALGAALLAIVFVPDFGWVEGLWQSVFHSVSAFNNAGFGLHHDSLTRWVDDPIINTVIPVLFITSGMGFIVMADIRQKRSWGGLSLHTRLMLVGTAALIVLGTVGFALLEWTNPLTLGSIDSLSGKLLASWFQGVTPRTAGFNSVDMTHIRDDTALMTITLMLIGGGSTSTAGGIKVTTFLVLLLATLAFFRRSGNLHAFGRSLGSEEIMKVLALTVTSMLVVMISLFLLILFQDGDFLKLAFEVASAFGTVGLSMGVTGELGPASQVIIIFVMFLGRVGPLTLGFFLAYRHTPLVRYPRGEIYLG